MEAEQEQTESVAKDWDFKWSTVEWNIGIVGVTPIHEGVDKYSATQEYSRQENTICHIQG